MSRVRAVDRELALDRAINAFWSKGYAATSLAELEVATGLGRSSLYQEFPSKRALYLSSLERYLAHRIRPELAALQAPGAGTRALRAYLSERADHLGHRTPRGCLIAGAMAELGPLDGEVRRIALAHHELVGGAIE